MLTKRIIPCLDVRQGEVVKGVRFRDHESVGDILPLARRYRDQGADELVFYDITASADGRSVGVEWVERVGALLDIPFCVAGGIRSVETGRRVLGAGADKLSVNSPALERPDLIDELVRAFGSQCVVVGVDSLEHNGEYQVHQYTGREQTSRPAARRTLEWIREVQERGAGEVVLNCMGSDGVGTGYDVAQLSAARGVLTIPLVASGGAGSTDHFETVFREARVDAALAAGIFHRGEHSVQQLKGELRSRGLEVRP